MDGKRKEQLHRPRETQRLLSEQRKTMQGQQERCHLQREKTGAEKIGSQAATFAWPAWLPSHPAGSWAQAEPRRFPCQPQATQMTLTLAQQHQLLSPAPAAHCDP